MLVPELSLGMLRCFLEPRVEPLLRQVRERLGNEGEQQAVRNESGPVVIVECRKLSAKQRCEHLGVVRVRQRLLAVSPTISDVAPYHDDNVVGAIPDFDFGSGNAIRKQAGNDVVDPGRRCALSGHQMTLHKGCPAPKAASGTILSYKLRESTDH